jgi:hypothetical protein
MRLLLAAAGIAILPHPLHAASVVEDDARLWSEHEVPYRICENVEIAGHSDPIRLGCEHGGRPLAMAEAAKVRAAVDVWNKSFGNELKFVEASRLPRGARGVLFERSNSDERCFSTQVGRPRRAVRTSIRIGARCNQFAHPTTPVHTITHEMLHVAGFYHEQQRPDRHAYLQISEGEGGLFGGLFDAPGARQWTRWGARSQSRPLGEYDFRSLMHYPIVDTKRVMLTSAGAVRLASQGLELAGPGRRDGFSPGDVEAMRVLYAR